MTAKSTGGRKRQLTRDDWVAAAQKVLVASGVDDVKVDRLSRRMAVTRGSFYWHFTNRQDLLDALLDRWRSQNAQEIAGVRARAGSDSDRLMEVVRLWLSEAPAYPAFDMAVRVWARKAPAVAVLVRQVDDEWIDLLRSIVRREGEDPLESLARARIFYFHQIGYYALGLDESLEARLAMAPYYNRVLLGDDGGDALARLMREVAPG